MRVMSMSEREHIACNDTVACASAKLPWTPCCRRPSNFCTTKCLLTSLSRRMFFGDEGCENFTHVLVLSCGLVFSLGKGGDDGGREENFLLICIIWDICLISCWRQFTNCFRLGDGGWKNKTKKAEINFALSIDIRCYRRPTGWKYSLRRVKIRC